MTKVFSRLPKFLAVTVLAVFAVVSPARAEFDPAAAERQAPEGQPVLEKYLEATRGQDEKLRGVAMDCDIEASLPSLNRKGKFHALRQISKVGQITYRKITFQGDNSIKNDVIARYLQAEKEAAEKGGNLGRTPDNYKFKYYGAYGEGEWKLHLFELTPKQKKPGLFQGWLWIEDQTGLPVREQGEFVKNPSIFLKRVEFVRDYEIREGVAVPVKVDSQVQTRIAGKAEISIRYSNVERAAEASAAVPPEQPAPSADSR